MFSTIHNFIYSAYETVILVNVYAQLQTLKVTLIVDGLSIILL